MKKIKLFILFVLMVFFHIYDDFHLQGILASMKQKDWWKEQTSDTMYKYDYIVALLAHAFSWTVMIHIPAVVYALVFQSRLEGAGFCIFVFVWMLLLHAVVDDLKANRHKINLIQDQLFHLWQIVIVLVVYAEADLPVRMN